MSRVRIFIQYNGSDSGYLASNVDLNPNPFRVIYGASNYTYPGFTVGGLKQEAVQLSLVSNASSPHRILSIQVQTVGFTIIQVQPPSPIAIPAQTQGLPIKLLFQSPFLGYNGELAVLLIAGG